MDRHVPLGGGVSGRRKEASHDGTAGGKRAVLRARPDRGGGAPAAGPAAPLAGSRRHAGPHRLMAMPLKTPGAAAFGPVLIAPPMSQSSKRMSRVSPSRRT